MKMRTLQLIALAVLFVLTAITAQAQTATSAVSGMITQNKTPVANYQIILTRDDIGKQYKGKTDKNGRYAILGVAFGECKVAVLSANGDVVYTKDSHRVSERSFDIDLANPEASGGKAGSGAAPAAAAPTAAKKVDAKLEGEAVAKLNALVTQAQAALREQKWADAEKALKQLLEMYPETTRWEFFKALGDSQVRLQKYSDAVQAYERGIQLAHAIASGSAPPDPRNPNPDPARATLGESQMLSSQGAAFLSLNQFDEAITRLKKAAETAPNPGTAYYNLCAAYFNNNKMTEAAAACEKSVAADPKNAEAWFFKGSATLKTATADGANNKGAQANAADAFNNYLKLDPDGPHAGEAKQALQKIASN